MVQWKEMEIGEFRQWSTQEAKFARIAKLEFTIDEFKIATKALFGVGSEGTEVVAVYGCPYDAPSNDPQHAVILLDFEGSEYVVPVPGCWFEGFEGLLENLKNGVIVK